MFRKRGFTLLELIIVIIVIGILASIALPKYLKITEKARTAEAKNALATIRSAQLRYYAQYGSYTDNITKTDAEFTLPKYFDLSAVNGTAGIGKAVRNTVDSSQGQYNITIDADGVLNISSGFEFLQ